MQATVLAVVAPRRRGLRQGGQGRRGGSHRAAAGQRAEAEGLLPLREALEDARGPRLKREALQMLQCIHMYMCLYMYVDMWRWPGMQRTKSLGPLRHAVSTCLVDLPETATVSVSLAYCTRLAS